MTAIDKLIQTADNEVGYLEKSSNSQLDDKTANAGMNNYTKYWLDIKNRKQKKVSQKSVRFYGFLTHSLYSFS